MPKEHSFCFDPMYGIEGLSNDDVVREKSEVEKTNPKSQINIGKMFSLGTRPTMLPPNF